MLGATIARTIFAAAKQRAAQRQMAAANKAVTRRGVFPRKAPALFQKLRPTTGVRPRPVAGVFPPPPVVLPPIMPPVLVATDGGGGAPAGGTAIATPAVEDVAQEMAPPTLAPAGFKGVLALAAIVGAFLVFGKAGRGRRNW